VTKLSILIIIASIGVIALLRKKITGDIADMISRSPDKKRRGQEDAPIGIVTKNLKDKTAEGISWLTEQWEKSTKPKKPATTEVIECPECGQRLRIPKDVNLTIECPRMKCKTVFDYDGKESDEKNIEC